MEGHVGTDSVTYYGKSRRSQSFRSEVTVVPPNGRSVQEAAVVVTDTTGPKRERSRGNYKRAGGGGGS